MIQDPSNAPSDLPSSKVRSRRVRLSYIWIVPIVAALVATYLVFNQVRELGPTLTLRFQSADGVKPGQTYLRYRGVDIGQVSEVRLGESNEFAVVKVKLRRFAEDVAREGSRFWIVRPRLNMGSITGLGTIISGPHIEVDPGQGKRATQFVGVENSPIMPEPEGIRIVLQARQANSLRAGIPVYYRGVDVGVVERTELNRNATAVNVHAIIRQRYARLVRTQSRFWNVTGLDFRFGLFRGAEINVESLRTLVLGGIAFATPDDPDSVPVRSGTVFQLHDQAKDEWLTWTPTIPLPSPDITGSSLGVQTEEFHEAGTLMSSE